MSLRRRLLWFLLLGTPAIWLLALGFSYWRAVDEINELFDTQQVRLAQQVRASLAGIQDIPTLGQNFATAKSEGEAEPEDLSVAVWDQTGRRVLSDREGVQLPRVAGFEGFKEWSLPAANGTQRWRVYYEKAQGGAWDIAVGQRLGERDELVVDLIAGQLGPWMILLPVLIVIILAGVKRALSPIHDISEGLVQRQADDLTPVQGAIPEELNPLVNALNQLFQRVRQALQHERQLTADAAHELRTPIAALRAHLEVAQLAQTPHAREHALHQTLKATERLNDLLNQLLLSARVDHAADTPQRQPINWQHVVEQVLNDTLNAVTRKSAEIECIWATAGVQPLPLNGDEGLLVIMLRNLVDNALRYGPPGVHIRISLEPHQLCIEDNGPGVSGAELARLGDRFYRPAGQSETGSGLGLSIVKRIAQAHALQVHIRARHPQGLSIIISR